MLRPLKHQWEEQKQESLSIQIGLEEVETHTQLWGRLFLCKSEIKAMENELFVWESVAPRKDMLASLFPQEGELWKEKKKMHEQAKAKL